MLLFTHALNPLLMLLVPVLLALWLRGRFRVPLGLWVFGALTFVASQIVHLPLNLGVARLFSSGALPMPSDAVLRWAVPLALGLSAGVCEEVARYVAFRLLVARVRGWADALMVGAGHGGIEAMLLGGLTALGYVNMVVLRSTDPAALGVPPDQVALVGEQVAAYWGMHPLMPLVGSLERVLAITCHLGMTVLVWRSIRHGVGWLFAAIAFHAALDAAAVAIAPHSVLGAEVVVAGFAAVAVGIVLALRERP